MKEEDFFMLSQKPEIPEEEYNRETGTVVDTLDAMSRITFQNLYAIDYCKRNFLYVSDNPLFLCGHTAQEVKELSYRFYDKHIPESEKAMLAEINRAGFDFYEKLPANEKLRCMMSYDFHLLNGKKTTLVNHKLTPLRLTGEGKIWLAACAVTPSTHTDPGHVIMYKTGEPVYWKYNLEQHCWEDKQTITLTEREREILLLTAQGYTMDEIAKKLCLETTTIKQHKGNLFEKLQAHNMMEALLFAENYKLL